MTDQAELSSDLARIVGRDYVRADEAALIPYATDATPLYSGLPDAVVFPKDTQQISEIVRYAVATRVPLIARGAGTNLAASTVPASGGIVLALSRLDQILSIDTAEQTVRVQPSVATGVLDDAVGVHGLMYPPDPGSRSVSTIGGNIATNAGGLRGLKYGVTGEYVRSLTAVLGTGEVIETGAGLAKDVAGYDVTSLLVGSEGTLAIVTEATLSVLARPECELLGVGYFDHLEQASSTVADIIAAGLRPSTLEFLDRTCIRVIEESNGLGLDTEAGALLLFGDDGTRDAASEAVAAMAERAEHHGARSTTTADSIAEVEDLRAARRCTLPALARFAPVTILEDVGVPRSRLVDMVRRIYEIAAQARLDVAVFGHAGDGNLHPTLLIDPSDADALDRADEAIAQVFQAAIDMGGTITGEHGIGLAKLPYLEQQLGGSHVELLRRIKQAFDPAGILNPGKLGS